MKKFFLVTLPLLLLSQVYTQELDKGYVQASLVYPIGTSWTKSKDREYNFSLNLLAGYTGGIKGVEFGTILNINRHNMHGVQAGLININKGDMKGFQVGPLVNWIEGDAAGANFSGLFTYNRGKFQGFEFSWFVNVNKGKFQGAMGSHFLNLVMDDMDGIQWALGPNIVTGDARGVQFSWTTNVATKYHNGIQISTLFNWAGETDGFQMGLVNVAKKSGGIQVGLINYSGDSSVAPIGLVNVVKRGYNKLEVWSNELNVFNVGFKMGGRRVYSMINVGGNPFNTNKFWSIGWGPGVHIPFTKNERFYGDFDNIFSLMNVNEFFSFGAGKTTINSHLRLIVGYELTKGVALFLGPTMQVIMSNNNSLERDGLYNANGIELAPTFRTAYFSAGEFQFAIWPGICGGIRFF